ncbi:MtrAB system histidine kinase MtrB [Bifidobacterium samirii]|uniref:Sensor histidine kinase MtrB n=1 Tax=Bifidobacterium samirii TaxID=2306974 RepID=A0A430FU01_9BIFI|nr:MtrAB system histidine kinase MtrB [Bifidobacterium samirii]RSX56388.1 two-component system sensor histidine kinase [Bifidobacterium samirii]
MSDTIRLLRSIRPPRLYRLALDRVRRSLQARTVLTVVTVSLAMAVVFAAASMAAVRASLLAQVTQEAHADFSAQLEDAQLTLDGTDASDTAACQRIVNDLAAAMQGKGASNRIGFYIWSRDAGGRTLIPVSTDITYEYLVSDAIRKAVAGTAAGDTDAGVSYQPVELDANGDGISAPGAMLGAAVRFPAAGDLDIFALYTYENEQTALERIQTNLMLVAILLSMSAGLMVWLALRGIVGPVEHVADAAATLAGGDLDARVGIDRDDEIGTLQRSFNDMADSLDRKIAELEAAEAMQRRFVSDVSHELRTPVTTMRMASDLLAARIDDYDPTTRRTIELLSGQIERFQDMLADLLEISRYDAGYATTDLTDADLRDTVGRAVAQLRALADAKDVPIRVNLPAGPAIVRADERRIERIVRNLLANAIDFADGHPIDVRIAAGDAAVVIGVRDHGVGMGADQCAHVFDRFWRADPSRSRVTGGTGLGLSIALADARLHHGTLDVRSRPGDGTCFLLALPRDPSAGEPMPDFLPMRFAGEASDDLCVVGWADGAGDDRREAADA